MFKITVKVEGLKCANCERHINEAISEAFAPKKVQSSHTENKTVIMTKKDIDEEKLKKVIEEAGYQAIEIQKEEKKTLFGF